MQLDWSPIARCLGQIVTVVTVKSPICRDVTPCSLAQTYQHFRRACIVSVCCYQTARCPKPNTLFKSVSQFGQVLLHWKGLRCHWVCVQHVRDRCHSKVGRLQRAPEAEPCALITCREGKAPQPGPLCRPGPNSNLLPAVARQR
jgi:hypothetical protein